MSSKERLVWTGEDKESKIFEVRSGSKTWFNVLDGFYNKKILGVPTFEEALWVQILMGKGYSDEEVWDKLNSNYPSGVWLRNGTGQYYDRVKVMGIPVGESTSTGNKEENGLIVSHELGHIEVEKRKIKPKEGLDEEAAAWEEAGKLGAFRDRDKRRTLEYIREQLRETQDR